MNKEDLEICDVHIIHKDIVNKVKKQMPQENDLYDLAELFKVFGDTTRIKILCTLFNNQMCVCDIAYTINMTHSAVSHQLRVLKQAKLVKYKKEGKTVYYSLNDDHIQRIFNEGLDHILEG